MKCEPDILLHCLQPLKTKLKASTAQMTLKSKPISGQNKSQSSAAISSQDEEAILLSLPVNGLALVSDDAIQGHLPSDGKSNLRADLLEFIPTKKSSRRKSYTTSLMERSKVVSQCIKLHFFFTLYLNLSHM